MKVEQAYIHGEVETEEKTEGDALHEELLAMERTTREDLLKDIETKRLVVASFPLVAETNEMVLVGVPDAVIFQSAKPIHIIELKTTRGDPQSFTTVNTHRQSAMGCCLIRSASTAMTLSSSS